MGQSPDLPDVRQISGQIRRMGTDNGSSVILKQGLYILGTHIPQRITSRSGEFHSLLFQTVQGPQNAVVFQHGRHHMITGPEQSAEDSVQALRHIGCKCDLRRPASKHSSKLFPHFVYCSGSIQRRTVHPSGTVSHMPDGLRHRKGHGFRAVILVAALSK